MQTAVEPGADRPKLLAYAEDALQRLGVRAPADDVGRPEPSIDEEISPSPEIDQGAPEPAADAQPPAAQVEGGVFYGVFVEGQLVAVAGTHLTSPTYRVAAVGNIFTHPEYRGRGYGTATTSAVVAELLAGGIRDLVLNLSQNNEGAIRIYERLGFERHGPMIYWDLPPS